MPSPTITRRAMIAGAGATISSAALAVPYVNAAPTHTEGETEAICDKVSRLSKELSEAMGEYLNGQFEAVVASDGNVWFQSRHRPLTAAVPVVNEIGLTGKADDLSFVSRLPEGGFDYWHIESVGNYADDCILGRELATEYLSYIGKRPTYGNVYLLSDIVGAMIAKGSSAKGLRIGFMSEVNRYTMASARFVATA